MEVIASEIPRTTTNSDVEERAGNLVRLANVLERNKERLAKVVTEDNRQPLKISKQEVGMTIDHLKSIYEKEGRKNKGASLD